MQVALGWLLLLLGGALYVAQVISSIDFQLAQRLGIQERPEDTDAILQTAERYTAYWDLLVPAWLPLAGLAMIVDHAWWPILGLLGGAIYLDAAGREAVKIISLRKEGFRLGTQTQQRLFFSSFIVMAIMGLVVIAYALVVLLR